jgi:SAM-dependent methyltransferase
MFPWGEFIERFQSGAWRAPIFRDMVLHDVKACGPSASVLDIGCGRGFDDEPRLQEEISSCSARYIGIEPDVSILAPPACDEYHACQLEDARIAAQSIDVAFAVFVIEHIEEPARFFAAAHSILRPGGVFWGFTVDARSAYAKVSSAVQALTIKDRYLNFLFGARERRHKNYPTYYAANTPARVATVANKFARVEAISLHHVGILDPVLPKLVCPLFRALDCATLTYGWPGANLAIRLVK